MPTVDLVESAAQVILGREKAGVSQTGGLRVPHSVFALYPEGSGEKRTKPNSVTCGSL